MEYVLLAVTLVMAFLLYKEHKRVTLLCESLRGFHLYADDRADELRSTLEEMQETDRQFSQSIEYRLTGLEKTMSDAEELLKEHAELEREAVNSERLFQEGLTSILNYGVVK